MRYTILLFLCILIIDRYGTAQENNIEAKKVIQGPIIDGRLNDSVWINAVPFSDFRMVEPAVGSDPSEKTEIRIIYDRTSMYIGIRCYDSQPRKIAANSMQHDNSEDSNEDQISILLDPFQDKRSGYLFIVNPKGARSEGYASGEHYSLAWDGIWDASSRIDAEGWTTEVCIPFKTISFNPRLTEWGINFERYIARKQEVIRFSGISLNSFFSNPRDAGLLLGIDSIKQGLGITFRPYGLAGAYHNVDSNAVDGHLSGGFDIYKNITPNLVAAFTYHTDFAETEVDDRQLNLTRFPLFYPEKRTFFLEGSDIFDFAGSNSSSFIPFFSRRIGLNNGVPEPIKWGVQNWNERKGGNKQAWGFKLDYPNDLLDMAVVYNFYGDSLDPGLGFLPRNAYHYLYSGFTYSPRPKNRWMAKVVRQWYFEFQMTNFWSLSGQLESREIFTAPINLRTQSGDHIEFNIIPNRDVLPEDFEVSKGVIIPKGDYKFLSYRAEFNSAGYRKVQLDLSYRFGQFYNGTYNDLTAGVTLKVDGYATLQLNANIINGNLPQGKFTENVYQAKLNLYITPDLGLSNYLQYDDVSNQMGYNGRFFWQFRPGNIINLVYNNNIVRRWDPESRFQLQEEQISLKVQLSIRL
jgi:hypothetical protein